MFSLLLWTCSQYHYQNSSVIWYLISYSGQEFSEHMNEWMTCISTSSLLSIMLHCLVPALKHGLTSVWEAWFIIKYIQCQHSDDEVNIKGNTHLLIMFIYLLFAALQAEIQRDHGHFQDSSWDIFVISKNGTLSCTYKLILLCNIIFSLHLL